MNATQQPGSAAQTGLAYPVDAWIASDERTVVILFNDDTAVALSVRPLANCWITLHVRPYLWHFYRVHEAAWRDVGFTKLKDGPHWQFKVQCRQREGSLLAHLQEAR